jgi:predicted permease
LPTDVYAIAVIIALMPLAASSVIYTRIFGGEPDYAASSSLVTTIASIVTIPLALWLLFR